MGIVVIGSMTAAIAIPASREWPPLAIREVLFQGPSRVHPGITAHRTEEAASVHQYTQPHAHSPAHQPRQSAAPRTAPQRAVERSVCPATGIDRLAESQ